MIGRKRVRKKMHPETIKDIRRHLVIARHPESDYIRVIAWIRDEIKSIRMNLRDFGIDEKELEAITERILKAKENAVQFTHIAPGVTLIGANANIKIAHPEFCYAMSNPEGTQYYESEGSLLIFSNEEIPRTGMNAKGHSDESFALKKFTWDELVDKFSKHYSKVTLDHTGEMGYYRVIPLQKNT